MIEKHWDTVFRVLKEYIDGASFSIMELKTSNSHWSGVISKNLFNLLARFTNASKEEKMLDQYGRWFRSIRPIPNETINFYDCTVKLQTCTEKSKDIVSTLAKSPSNDCYFDVPIELSTKIDDETRKKLRLFLATVYAGNPEVRRINLALESLVWFGKELPQKMIIVRGNGGDGKSAYSTLRSSVFGENHYFVGPSVFEQEEEFRKQGLGFASARFLTVQECNGGSFLQEAVFKSFIGGEKIPCRPNYAKNTEYFSWERCGKVWEMNMSAPRVNGDPNNIASLKSYIRRLIVCEMESSFT